MSSIQVVTPVSAPSSGPSALEQFLSSLKRTRSAKTIALHQKRLQYLAQNFDPFAGAMDSECQQILAHYKLELDAQDPFRFTNLVLQMLDALEERSRGTASV
jgi:hypothetical protein